GTRPVDRTSPPGPPPAGLRSPTPARRTGTGWRRPRRTWRQTAAWRHEGSAAAGLAPRVTELTLVSTEAARRVAPPSTVAQPSTVERERGRPWVPVVVARERPRRVSLRPGHDQWDYRHS